MTNPETPPAPPTYVQIGEVITADSVIDPETQSRHRLASLDPDGTRWIRAVVGVSLQSAAFYRDRGLIPVLVEAGLSRKYLALDGRSFSDTPVNAVPYLQDYRHVLGTFAHQLMTTPEPKLKQLVGAGSRQIHPDDPHDDNSAHAYGALMDWGRGVIGMIWKDMETWEALDPPPNPAFGVQKALVDKRMKQVCGQCATKNWAVMMLLNMHPALQRAAMRTGSFYEMNRNSKPWGIGGFIGSKPGGLTVEEAHDQWVASFTDALHHYYDNDLGNAPPRDQYDRPIYIAASFFPPTHEH